MKRLLLFIPMVFICIFSFMAFSTIYYVNGTTGNDTWDGLAAEWDGTHGPKKTIQAGIDASSNTDTVIVADGTYKGNGNRDIDFLGKAITLISENGPEFAIIDGEAFYPDNYRGFDFHSGESRSSVLDGFTVKSFYIWVNNTEPGGGGMLCTNNSSPTVTNCIIKDNMIGCYDSNKIGGAGIAIVDGSPVISHCIIKNNELGWYRNGAGIYCSNGSQSITDCIISNNMAGFWGEDGFYGGSGGGIYCGENSNTMVLNCIISRNQAGLSGGGICFGDLSNINIINCTMTSNWGQQYGGGISNDTNQGIYPSSAKTVNSIFWGDESDEIYISGNLASALFNYCDVQDGMNPAFDGGNNINSDPFLTVEGRLSTGSPCIDTGTNGAPDLPSYDLDGNHRIWFGATSWTVDMGAYEFGSQPMKIKEMSLTTEGNIELTWNSSVMPGATYTVMYSDDEYSATMSWSMLQAGIPSGGAETSYVDTTAPAGAYRYYKILDE